MVSFLTIIMLLTSLLSGCKAKTDAPTTTPESTTSTSASSDATVTDAPAKPEPITLDVFVGDPGQVPTKDNKIYKLIEDEFGIKFNFEFLVGDLNQKLGVMIASGDYPDIMSGSNESQKLIDADAFIAMDDYITDATPNLKAHIDPYINQIKDPKKGKIYVIPNYGRYYGEVNTTYYSGPAFWIQKAVLKEFNYPKIKTLDQYFDLIQQYKDKYPQIDGQPTIGFQICTFDWRAFCLKNAPAQLSGHPNDGGVNVDNNVATLYANTDIAKQYYKKINEEYNAGLVMPETFVENYDEYLAKLSTGTVLGMFDQGWNFQPATDSLVSQEKFERTYAPLPIVFDESTTPYYRDRPALNLNRGFGITVNCKDPERVVKLFDALLSEKWQKILNWGIEGEDYYVDDNGMFYRDETQRKNADDANWKLANRADALLNNLPKIEGTFSDGNASNAGSQPDEYFATLKPYDQEFLAAYGIKMLADLMGSAPENPKYYPAYSIALGDGTDAAIASQKIDEIQAKYLPQVILSKTDEFDSLWNDYIKKYDDVNVKAYIDLMNEQIQWRMNNW